MLVIYVRDRRPDLISGILGHTLGVAHVQFRFFNRGHFTQRVCIDASCS